MPYLVLQLSMWQRWWWDNDSRDATRSTHSVGTFKSLGLIVLTLD